MSARTRASAICGTRQACAIGRIFSRARKSVFAASAPGTAGNVDIAMLRELFGVKLEQINGYPGSADKRLAVEKGEVDGDCGGWTPMPQDWLREHKVNVSCGCRRRWCPAWTRKSRLPAIW